MIPSVPFIHKIVNFPFFSKQENAFNAASKWLYLGESNQLRTILTLSDDSFAGNPEH